MEPPHSGPVTVQKAAWTSLYSLSPTFASFDSYTPRRQDPPSAPSLPSPILSYPRNTRHPLRNQSVIPSLCFVLESFVVSLTENSHILQLQSPEEVVGELVRFALGRKVTTSAWLHCVVIIDSAGEFPSTDWIDALEERIRNVDVRRGKKPPEDLTQRSESGANFRLCSACAFGCNIRNNEVCTVTMPLKSLQLYRVSHVVPSSRRIYPSLWLAGGVEMTAKTYVRGTPEPSPPTQCGDSLWIHYLSELELVSLAKPFSDRSSATHQESEPPNTQFAKPVDLKCAKDSLSPEFSYERDVKVHSQSPCIFENVDHPRSKVWRTMPTPLNHLPNWIG